MQNKNEKFIYWTPRILSIIFIIFLSLFSLDVFGNGYSAKETIIALFMHNIPSLALLIILLISWKREIVGAVAFLLAGLAYIIMVFSNEFEWYYLAWAVQISGPAFFISYLFLLNWKRKKI